MMENTSKYCPEWRDALADRHLDDLSPHEREAFDAHLPSCPFCTATLAADQEMDMLLRKAFLPEKSLPSWEEVIQRKPHEVSTALSISQDEANTAVFDSSTKERARENQLLPQSFDVCIVCALPEEARAFLEVVQQGEGGLGEYISSRYRYSYRFATIKNNKDESLNLHISWLPRYGPQEMTLHLSRVLEECQPRIAVMTGICAGDAQRVQLGDLVVAERTFTYDNGKFTLDEHGRSVHLHDTTTYQLDANILQFLGLFEDWKPLVARLKRPPSPPKQRKRHKIACYIKPMASGSAVRADHPFEDVRAPVRGTVAIEMEGAAFGLVMSHHPLIPWLIVKGVCDYADQDKNDAYHEFAARASALYALSFIQAYVTNERLPRSGGLAPRSRAGSTGVWNVPLLRNPHFTGRDELLDRLNEHLAPAAHSEQRTQQRVALTQSQAITGLGGIGKTQIAVEYAYRSREQDRYTHTLWINAASEETIIASFVALAADALPASIVQNETDQCKLAAAVRRWLERCEQRWLLIFDNADAPSMIEPYLPREGNGSTLLTTRAHAFGALATSVEVETMGLLEGTQLLLRRAQRFEQVSEEEINEATNIVIALDHFPLALDQAGAYLEETQCSFMDYLDLYQTHRQEMLTRRGRQATRYPDSVATTWSLSFQKVQQVNPAAAELLQLCSFLAPDRIPEELITNGGTYWPSLLQKAVSDRFTFQQIIEELLKFSLVKRLTDDRMLSIHRLVQAVQVDMMKPEVQRQWVESIILTVNEIFPHTSEDVATWPQCLRYLEQVQACDILIQEHTLVLIEAADLLNRTAIYLSQNALYTLAEPLYQRALTIRQHLLGNDHLDTAAVVHNLAALHYTQGKYDLAESLYQRTLTIRQHLLGNDHPSIATSMHDLAALYYTQGKYDLAESFYQQALTIYQNGPGTDNPDTAHILNDLALLYRAQGKYRQAETLYRQALGIRERVLGPDHPDTATSLNCLAALCRIQGSYEQAETLHRQALGIRERVLGPDHPDTATSLNDLALLLYAQKNYDQAILFLKQAFEIYKRKLGSDHPHTIGSLNNLAALYKAQGKYEQAEFLYYEALASRKRVLGVDHPGVATSLNNLAKLYECQGKYEQAEPLYQRALAIREQQLGATHPDTAISLNNLASLYYARERYEEAEPLLQQALAIYEQELGRKHPTTQTIRKDYVTLLRTLGRNTEAKKLEVEF